MTFAMQKFGAALCVAGLWGTATVAQSVPAQINVTGTGTIAATPDMAYMTLGVVQDAQTAAAAMDAMATAMDSVLAQLRAADIEAADIQTGTLRLDPRYSDYVDGETRRVVGYVASTDVQVQVYDLDNLGNVLDLAVRDGANQMDGLRFDVAEPAPFLNAARQAAVADAQDKAQLYSQAAGVTLGPIMLISEVDNADGPVPLMAEMAFDSARKTVPIAAGEMSISANITMVWALEN
tara:strand:+ start:21233 stop:21940 length:708 start_codon:yes stop_codon:yes gene_type:complete